MQNVSVITPLNRVDVRVGRGDCEDVAMDVSARTMLWFKIYGLIELEDWSLSGISFIVVSIEEEAPVVV